MQRVIFENVSSELKIKQICFILHAKYHEVCFLIKGSVFQKKKITLGKVVGADWPK